MVNKIWMEIERNVFYNKRTGQPSIVLPKKFLDNIPKTVKLKLLSIRKRK